ncbi:MAG: hypothetical protein U1E56_02135 [Bauldia sp.]
MTEPRKTTDPKVEQDKAADAALNAALDAALAKAGFPDEASVAAGGIPVAPAEPETPRAASRARLKDSLRHRDRPASAPAPPADDGDGDRRFAKAVRALLKDHHREQLARCGMDEVAGIAALLMVHDLASRDFPSYVRWAIREAGHDPKAIFRELNAADPGRSRPPDGPGNAEVLGALAALHREIGALRQAQEEATRQHLAVALDRMRSALAEDGTPAFPHLERVKPVLLDQMQMPTIAGVSDPEERLRRAYDAAVYADPALRREAIAAEVARRQAETDRQADIGKARRARPLVAAPPPGNPPIRKAKTLDEAVSEAMRRLGV